MLKSSMIYRTMLPLLILIATAALIIPVGHAQEAQNQAGVIIRYGDGRVQTACVRFSEPSITGIDLLQRAGIPVIAQSSGLGAAVCKISNEGCDYPAEDCFCQCKGGNCGYWAYQRLRGDRWAYSPIGASASQVQPGDVDGWAWGAGSVQSGAAPPVIPLDQICQENPVAAPTSETQAATPVPTPAQPPITTDLVSTPAPAPIATSTSLPATAIAPKPTIVPVPTVIRISATLLPTNTPIPVLPSVPAPASEPVLAPTNISALTATSPALANVPTILPPTNAMLASTPTSISIVITPTKPQPQQAASAPGSTTTYLIFGMLVLLLGGGIMLALRRNRGNRQ